ncbi:MAG: CHASE3 domain-containing protein, partial [Ramlibacter sp.]
MHDVLAVRTSRGIGRDLTLSGFVAAGLAAVLFVAGTYWLMLQQARAQAWISHTHAVLASVAGTRADLAGIQDTQQRFFTSGRDEDLQAYTAIRSAIVVDVQRLREMTGDNPVQQRNAAEVHDALGPRLAAADAANAARRSDGREAAQALVEADAAVGHARRLRDALQRMTTEEARLLATRLSEHERQLNAFWAAIAIMLAALLLALGFLSLQQRGRERAEHDLLESERRFHLMADSVTDYAILMLDVAGNVQSWNAGAQRIKGYQASQILGRHFSCFYTPEDLEAGTPQQALADAADEGRYVAEGWRVRKDGSRFWASVLITPLRDPQGHITG